MNQAKTTFQKLNTNYRKEIETEELKEIDQEEKVTGKEETTIVETTTITQEI